MSNMGITTLWAIHKMAYIYLLIAWKSNQNMTA